jgi:hypothetical protein
VGLARGLDLEVTHIHFLEPRADGHRMQYVRRLIELVPQSCRMTLSTFPSSEGHVGFSQVVEAAQGRLHVQWMANEAAFDKRIHAANGLKLQPAYWSLFRRHWLSLSADEAGDMVVLPYLDYCSYAIGAIGSPFGLLPYSGIAMRPDFHWHEQGVVAPGSKHSAMKRWLFQRMLRQSSLRCLLTIDPSLRDWLARRRPTGFEKACYAQDPADLVGSGGRSEARKRYGVRDASVVVLVFGSIEIRKGIIQILQLAASECCPDSVQILIVGRQSPEVKQLIHTKEKGLDKDRIVCCDQFVDRQDEWLAFAAADLGWLAYDGFYGPSGVLAQFMQARLPVIHKGDGIIGYTLGHAQSCNIQWLNDAGLKCSIMPPPAPHHGLGQVLIGCKEASLTWP